MPLVEAEADVSQVEETAHIRSSGSPQGRQGGRERPLCLRETTVAVWRKGSSGWKKRIRPEEHWIDLQRTSFFTRYEG